MIAVTREPFWYNMWNTRSRQGQGEEDRCLERSHTMLFMFYHIHYVKQIIELYKDDIGLVPLPIGVVCIPITAGVAVVGCVHYLI